MNSVPSFSDFFRAIWEYNPFPWQEMLAEQIAVRRWPQSLDLPTAAGKTACMDAAIYALACQADRAVADRTAPRRIWFVVDRRIVVDEAHNRAATIARKLNDAKQGLLKEVADRLRQISGTERPLAVARLRGGVLRDDGWGRLPSQPAVITSTVDQIGSRLFFRGYGHSQLAAPIFAGLAAHDSLILLDEAHCSVPFLQTLRSIETYRGERWADSQIRTPFAFVVLSATPPPGIPDEAIFPGVQRDQALAHPVLRDRLRASKRAELVEVKAQRGRQDDPLVGKAVERALSYMRESGKRRVAVIVNRVRTAEQVAGALRIQANEDADVVLLTGRIRPFERDRLVEKWKPFLKAYRPDEPGKPVLLVSTQCIEVGADFSFDALVTECASLDALRQRFGRLNRMGLLGSAPATILIREQDSRASEPDPVYGMALSETWSLLNKKSTTAGDGKVGRGIDFGFEALDTTLSDVEDLSPYLAPSPDAPVLLPAHLDLLCQTAPAPHPEPDVQIFLHGKQRGVPEVQVVWRTDLSRGNTEIWRETVALCPPGSGEMLSVPLYRLRAWLASPETLDNTGDVEGAASPDGDSPGRIRPCLVWRGRDRSTVCRDASQIRPNDLVILPAAYGIAGLGQSAVAEAMGEQALDLWEPAHTVTGRSPGLRLHRAVLQPWLSCPALKDLVALAEDPAWDLKALREGVDAVLDYQPTGDDAPAEPPPWLLDLLRKTCDGRVENHPSGGVVLFARNGARNRVAGEYDLFADDDDLTSAGGREVSLSAHSAFVERAVEKLAARCLPNEFLNPLRVAARWHDAGKLDERFQLLLHHGDELAATNGESLAKSASVPTSPARRQAIREASGLPADFRHEMLSAQLAERYACLPEAEEAAALILHLITSHHGYARPFAPISPDSEPPTVSGRLNGADIVLTAEERSRLIPMHRLDSGISERFWHLTRCYGWWGLSYLEAIFRLGDWYGSQFVSDESTEVIP